MYLKKKYNYISYTINSNTAEMITTIYKYHTYTDFVKMVLSF